MRVIAGEWRGRSLSAPAGRQVRPTSDKMRGALFSILGERVRGARFADLCAGSGAVGIEALSRGAAHCIFVESGREVVPTLRANLAAFGLGPGTGAETGAGAPAGTRARVLATDVLSAIRQGELAGCDLVFADPPWDSGLGAAILLALSEGPESGPGALPGGAEIILEHRRTAPPPEAPARWRPARSVRHGEGMISFYSRAFCPGEGPSGSSD